MDPHFHRVGVNWYGGPRWYYGSSWEGRPRGGGHWHGGHWHGGHWYGGHRHGGHWHGRGWDGRGWAGGQPWWWDWWPLVPTLLFAALVLAGMVMLSRHSATLLTGTPLAKRIAGRALPGGAAKKPDAAADLRARWDDAVRRYRATAQAYAGYECDVREVLRLPALADVREPATGRFVDAFAEAGALCTERYPGPEYAQRFIDAVERAERAWDAAVQAAERTRDARFTAGERRLVEQVTALLDLALASPHEAERRTAYQRATVRLAELERRTAWRLPRPAAAALEHRTRAALVPATG